MEDKRNLPFIDVDDLLIGVFIHLDLGWMSHPFSKSSFRINSVEQIGTLKELGLKRVRWSPQDSDFEVIKAIKVRSRLDDHPSGLLSEPADKSSLSNDALALKLALEDQRAVMRACEKGFAHATETCAMITDMVPRDSVNAAERARTLICEMVDGITKHPNVCIRLLTEAAGDRASLHAVNVMILSLLLARSLGWNLTDMTEMGVGALLHDIGKLDLNDRLRHPDASFTATEHRAYEEHVSFGIDRARKMGLSSIATLVIAQHHEMSDGSGSPLHLINDRISLAARLVALVNRYDNLCNPHIISQALTPHEAIAHIYAQNSFKFDSVILAAFVKMMGVYPVGSIVQLNDGRFAMVVAVNVGRSLRPSVLIHDTKVPRREALIVDLAQRPQLSIRRSVKPLSLPAESMIYLSPRQRVAYFFESSRIPDPQMELA
ncbi:MAG: HD-GYP domain-containing protein [Burkholderiales bacterium]